MKRRNKAFFLAVVYAIPGFFSDLFLAMNRYLSPSELLIPTPSMIMQFHPVTEEKYT
jgi:hypothetical protein